MQDPLYGTVEVEPVMAALLHTPPLQRLERVHQAGAAALLQPKWNVTRLEHSIGVMLLIRRLGGSLPEQAAALLHDVSHTAFSHLVDQVLDHPDEDYHEKQLERVIKHPAIEEAIAPMGWKVEDLLPLERWSILEQPAPDLCADRIDYTLRDQYHYGGLSLHEIHAFLEMLTLVQGRIAVRSLAWAEWFVDAYYREVVHFFLDPKNVYANDRLSTVLRQAMVEGVITEDDWMKTDQKLLQQVKDRGGEALLRDLSEIRPGIRLQISHPDDNWDIHFKQKVRWVDPLVISKNGDIVRASQLSTKIRNQTQEAIERMKAGVYVRIV
ncbi:hypothetical protein C8J48_0992 [Desmospora activa DSM 45169]|uniref:HD domain-containing protein n=1 Tax=Desmospora activa DSM 45169 TaxID=1121389 RepID=A0A2T4Z951_9BACL|nr:hypothetical protein C8J48_0992 [Desmospora activa DSM 45169]